MTKRKPKKDSLIDFTEKYANNEEACWGALRKEVGFCGAKSDARC